MEQGKFCRPLRGVSGELRGHRPMSRPDDNSETANALKYLQFLGRLSNGTKLASIWMDKDPT